MDVLVTILRLLCVAPRMAKLCFLSLIFACVFAMIMLFESSILYGTLEPVESIYGVETDEFFPPWDSFVNGTWAGPLELCPEPHRPRVFDVSLKLNDISYEKLEEKFGKYMQDGGHFVPRTCLSRDHLALIIPYRDRQRNLYILLNNLFPFLWRQQVEFTVFLVEQTPSYNFNKGLMFNVAFLESQKKANITCFIMQDVDLLPMDHRNYYRCDLFPRHLVLTVGKTKWSPKLTYPTAFGGAVALRKEHITRANGFSVSYYGWGLEDDDLALRLWKIGFGILRYPVMVGKYYKLDHKRQAPNSQGKKMRRTIFARLKQGDGLSSMKYTLLAREEKKLFTRLLVEPPPPPVSIYGVVPPKVSRPTPKDRNITQ